jgi:hypothetical protein
LDDGLRQLLRDLGRALHEAIADSEQVVAAIRELRRQGYTLQVQLDCRREESGDEMPVPMLAVARAAANGAQLDPVPGGLPSFRINGTDLAFLRSIGIDPTRRRRARPKTPRP